MTPTLEQTAEERIRWMVSQLEADGVLPDGTSLEQLLRELISLRLTNQRLEAEAERFQSRLQGMSDAIVEKDATASKLRLEVERMKKDSELIRDLREWTLELRSVWEWRRNSTAKNDRDMKMLDDHIELATDRLRELESEKGHEETTKTVD